MPRQAGLSGMRFVDEFVCRGCGAQEAFRSRPRGFFEKYVLPLFLLRTVRCAGCFQRSYVLRTIPALARVQSNREQPS
jgi:hypothetical protein